MGLIAATLIGAAIGAMVRGTGAIADNKSSRASLKEQIEYLEQDRDDYLKKLDNQFNIDKLNTFAKADVMDDRLDIKERSLDRNINNELSMMSANEKELALNVLNIQKQSRMAKGQARAEIATSGTRGSTMESAVDMNDTVQIDGETQTQAQIAQKTARAEIDGLRNRAINNYIESRYSIQDSREDTFNQRAMYAQEGDSYKGDMKYQMTGNAYTAYKIQRDYDENQYNKQIQKLEDQREYLSSRWGFWSNVGRAMIGGSIEGAQTGYNIGKSEGFTWHNISGN